VTAHLTRLTRPAHHLVLPLGLVVAVLGACVDSPPAGRVDASADARTDTGANGGADAQPETSAAPDAMPDALPNAPTDAGPDTELDTVPDTAPDTAVDTGPPAPPVLLLTVNEIPATMNGSIPYTQVTAQDPDGTQEHPFTLRVNRADFTLDASLDPREGPAPWDALALTCDADLTLPSGVLWPAGAPLSGADMEATEDPAHVRVHFGPAPAGPAGLQVRCEATVEGPGGTSTSAVPFELGELLPSLDPFPQQDPWLIVLGRDMFHLRVEPAEGGTYDVVSEHVPQGDGVPDLDEALSALGLMSATHPELAALSRQRILDGVRAELERIFGLDAATPPGEGVRLALWFEGDPGAPDPATWGDSEPPAFSMIALGGDATPADQADHVVGKATIDANNQHREDDTGYGLGIFTTSLARQILANPLGVMALGEFLPAAGGTPVGDAPGDEAFLAPGWTVEDADTPAQADRGQLYLLALDLLSRALGSLTAHEMGHSLGLVPNGPPPQGLFGGVAGLSFTDHDLSGWHIDTPGLNVMQTGAVTDWTKALSERPRFNALNLAYLRRRLVVGTDAVTAQ